MSTAPFNDALLSKVIKPIILLLSFGMLFKIYSCRNHIACPTQTWRGVETCLRSQAGSQGDLRSSLTFALHSDPHNNSKREWKLDGAIQLTASKLNHANDILIEFSPRSVQYRAKYIFQNLVKPRRAKTKTERYRPAVTANDPFLEEKE